MAPRRPPSFGGGRVVGIDLDHCLFAARFPLHRARANVLFPPGRLLTQSVDEFQMHDHHRPDRRGILGRDLKSDQAPAARAVTEPF